MTLTRLPVDSGESLTLAPDWVTAEMPAGYHNRLAEIQRLTEDLRAMDPFGRLLWGSGSQLIESVQDVFLALRFEPVPLPSAGPSAVGVKLDTRRLLVHVSPAATLVRRKSGDLAQVFQLLHESAEDGDRVVLVANAEPTMRPSDRPDGIDTEAAAFLRRMGANFLPSVTLFRLWTMSLHDLERARACIRQLHAQDGGVFLLPA